MYPQVELKIINGIPHIVYKTNEEEQKVMTQGKHSIYDVALSGAKKLNLISSEAEPNRENFEKMTQLARESDEIFYTELPEINTETSDFSLQETLENYLSKMLEEPVDEYSDLAMTDDVKEELERFRNSDYFASYLEALYSVLIAKTVLSAHDLGIGNISLSDDLKNPRLVEKMSKELEKLGLELVVQN